MAQVQPVVPAVVTGQVVMAQPVVAVQPVAAVVYDPTNIETYFGRGVIMKQKTSQCCRCCCLQPNIHWEYAPLTEEIETLGQTSQGAGKALGGYHMHAQEDAPYVGRCCSFCAPGFRTTKYTVSAGNDGSGSALFSHEKRQTCGQNAVVGIDPNSGQLIRCPMCCCLPYLETKDANGQLLGKSQYLCDACLWVPKYSVLNASGQEDFRVRPDVCCCGCCVVCKCCDGKKKAKCFRIPFYIRDPVTKEKLDGGEAYISDLWAGWAHECCTKKDLYAIKFPTKATTAQKATLLGCAHLIDLTIMEQDE